MTVSSEREDLERAVAEYEADDYTVERDVDVTSLGVTSSDGRVDFVARKGEEIVLVEVKSRATLHGAFFGKLTKLAEEIPNARVDLIWTGESKPLPDSEVVSSFIERSQDVFYKDPDAGLLLAWAALEGAVRKLLAEQELPAEGLVSCRQGLSDLYGNRLISWYSYSQLMRLSRVRNAIAHGEQADFSEDQFNLLREYCRFFTSSDFMPYEDVIDVVRGVVDTTERDDLARDWRTMYRSEFGKQLFQSLPTFIPATDIEEVLSKLTNDRT